MTVIHSNHQARLLYHLAIALQKATLMISFCCHVHLVALGQQMHKSLVFSSQPPTMVDKGADSVDFALVNLLQKGDIVVTQDYGLAAICMSLGAQPVHQDGWLYTADNIDALLLARHTASKIRRGGGRLRGSAKRTAAQDADFMRGLELILTL